MSIRLSYERLNLPLEFTFTISRGSLEQAKTVLVKVETTVNGQTIQGLGEAVPSRFYGEDQDSVCSFYDEVNAKKLLENLDPLNQQLYEDRMAKIPENRGAKSGLEIALWDLRGKLLNQPVWKLWGLDAAKTPKTSYTIGIADLETIRRKTLTALERGYDVLKIKLGSPEDVPALKLIRELAPEATIRVDANAAWGVEDALRMMEVLQACRVEFVEEPLKLDSSPADYERLYRESPILLMADESCHTLKDIPKCAQYFGSVNLKHSKTGGLMEAMRMIHAARAHDMKIMLGCFCESSVSISGFAQLAPLVDYLDLDGSLLVANDPYKGVTFEGSQLQLLNSPGIGVTAK